MSRIFTFCSECTILQPVIGNSTLKGDCRGYGEGGIRTPEELASLTVFETVAFNHSATSPRGADVQLIIVAYCWV